MLHASDGLKNEVTVLLDRVFTGETLTFFGEDGGGQYGRSTFPVSHAIRAFDVDVETFSDDIAETAVYVRIFLDGYVASTHGHAITDSNLHINLNRLLDREFIDRKALDWAPISYQGETFICLKVDAAKLLEW